MPEIQWVLCPVCRNKTRLKIRGDTILINFPLYCPKCKQETLITAQNLNISIDLIAKIERVYYGRENYFMWRQLYRMSKI